MLTRFVAMNLNGKLSCDLHLNPDLNIITGKNGAGKTTILKAIYCLLAGSIEIIAREIPFDLVSLTTNRCSIEIRATNDNKYRITFKSSSSDETLDDLPLEALRREIESVRSLNHAIAQLHSSLFFPTFRRIEGGFSMGETPRQRRSEVETIQDLLHERDYPTGTGPGQTIQQGLSRLSQRMSLYNHTFISSISTLDIITLLTAKYAAISETTNSTHKRLSEEIFSLIGKYDALPGSDQQSQLDEATSTLQAIKDRVNRFNDFSDAALKPFTTFSGIVKTIFEDKGIAVSENIILGDVTKAIRSQILSSGEKHMLSFLSYNAFSDGVAFFIDEPEISLHADWQRILFPTLLDQGTRNQFIVATHSPFIYSKYPDRELVLNPDRGDHLDAGA